MEERAVCVKGEGGLLARLRSLRADAARVMAELDPSSLTGSEAERVLAEVTAVRNIAAGAMPALAARITDSGRWRQAEARSAGAHVGSLTGGSASAGQRLADTGRHLEIAPEARRALGQGLISIDQAEQIAAAVAETASSPRPEIAARAPDVEQRLLETAGTGDLARLRDEAAKAKQAARDEAALRRVQHDTRHCKPRRFDDGSVGGQFKLPPLIGGELWAVLDRLTGQRFEHQRSAGMREPRDAYAADALCLALGIAPSTHPDRPTERPTCGKHPAARDRSEARDGSARQDRPAGRDRSEAHDGAARQDRPAPADPEGPVGEPKVNLHKELVVIVDADSLRNGTVGPDGTCEIPGVGPVAVQAARELLGDAGVNIVVTNGVDIAHVTVGGRRLSKAMRLAMLTSGGWRCGDCGTPYRLQGDHDIPYALTRHTKLAELTPRCPVCHQRKTKSEAPTTTAAGRSHRRAAAALIAALSLMLVTRGP